MTILKTNIDLYPELESLMDDFISTEMNDVKRKNHSPEDSTLPKVNIYENDQAFRIDLAAPGLNKDHFKIELDKDVLTISSDFRTSEEGKNYLRKEFAYGSFRRAFTLPDTADFEKIGARYINGILSLEIPKMNVRKPEPRKSIKIS